MAPISPLPHNDDWYTMLVYALLGLIGAALRIGVTWDTNRPTLARGLTTLGAGMAFAAMGSTMATEWAGWGAAASGMVALFWGIVAIVVVEWFAQLDFKQLFNDWLPGFRKGGH
jgi:prepilin signal peptidase PulO-like enzyme (type II secretory pathway)